MSEQLWAPIVAALVVSVMGAVLSVFVVLKRLAFIGQGVSHAAFGGVGIALLLGLHGVTAAGQVGQMAVVVAFSVAAALYIAALTRAQKGRTDTAIGVVLSASMALGFVLFAINESRHEHPEPAMVQAEHDHDHDHDHAGHDHGGGGASGHSDEHHVIEEILFGNILETDWPRAGTAVVVAVGLIAAVWWMRRKLIFWAFDEPVCDAFGVNGQRMTNVLLVVLAIAVVMSMQVVGVILAAAVLVLPGAAALNLSSNLRGVFAWSVVVALVGCVVGLWVGLASGYPTGPCIVLAQTGCYLLSRATQSTLVRRAGLAGIPSA